MGTITEIKNADGEAIETKFKNTFGIHAGILFSRDENDNVVAPIITLSVLDLQFGLWLRIG